MKYKAGVNVRQENLVNHCTYTLSRLWRISHIFEQARYKVQKFLFIFYVLDSTGMNLVSFTFQSQMLTGEVDSCGIFKCL